MVIYWGNLESSLRSDRAGGMKEHQRRNQKQNSHGKSVAVKCPGNNFIENQSRTPNNHHSSRGAWGLSPDYELQTKKATSNHAFAVQLTIC
jgi:hypothetical protein